MSKFQKLLTWSERMQGARLMLCYLKDTRQLDFFPDCPKKKGKDIYNQALYNWLIDDLGHIDMFMSGCDIFFYDHQKDKRGNLISVKIRTEYEK